MFGKGDVRGIIAPESANNSTVAADLVPALLFSVPGGPAAAVFLGALFSYGFYPGPRFVQENMDLMFVIIWSIVISSILGAAICFFASPYIAKITTIPFAQIAAPLILVMTLGAYQSTQHFGDIILLISLGLLGWAMTKGGWPRAPMLIGFVLANPMERQLWLTYRLHGWDWVLFPGVLLIASFIFIPLLFNAFKRLRAGRQVNLSPEAPAEHAQTATPAGSRLNVSFILSIFFLAIFSLGLWQASQFYPDARLLPLAITIPGFLFAVFRVVREWVNPWQADEDGDNAVLDSIQQKEIARSELLHFGGLILFGLALLLIGFYAATIAFMAVVLLWRAKMTWWWAMLYIAIVVLALDRMAFFMNIRLPSPLLF